ncbi:phage integrase family protein [Vibrio crassostreae]|uniref:tyrosine-type recombinase/integrase n=1 Tax=Vibrio TaxID=662 RepID=UPI0011501F8D|nr:site-specific integrase [Vibrio crassostreae]TQL30718.1 phage integrase family protein [Vibrio crassostreae]
MPVSLLKSFECWDYYSPLDNKLKVVDANDTPFITYDNGMPCFEANMYMHKQLREGKSRKLGGGTLKAFANQIIHLVHFCFKNQLQFSQLTDSTFRLFVQGLQSERDNIGELKRSNNRVRDIAHRCLDFLQFVQHCHDLDNFIGIRKEDAITVQIKSHKIPIEGHKRKIEKKVTTHSCIPSKDAVKKRFPVSEAAALKVWEHIINQENREKRLRDIAFYQCLEQLGARINEILYITIDDVKRATVSDSNPQLRLTTLKKQGNKARSIPVTHALLATIKEYINKVRKKVIKRTIGKKSDHGYLFVSLTTGQKISSDTFINQMNQWKRELNIEGELHAHLYRHAFITNKLIEIILQHKEINSADKFRENLLNTQKFKMQLQQWTGHTHLSSIDTYIDLAFADINGYTEAYNQVQLKDSVKLIQRQVYQVKKQLKDKEITLSEGILRFDNILNAFEKDINNSTLNIS